MKKIMFNDKYGLTQAVLEGRKTMTRRIVPIGLDNQTDWKAVAEGNYVSVVDGEGYVHDIRNCGNYRIGEVIAIAQSYNDIYEELKRTHGSSSYVTRQFFHKYIQGGRMPVSNKMFVKSNAMVHRIKITNVKVEQLQDISDEDILREGVLQSADGYDCYTFDGWVKRTKGKELPTQIYTKNRREAFATLIDKVSGKGTWQSNPWVFVYEFDRIA